MDIKEMKDRIDKHITSLLGVNIEQVIPTANFRDDLGADSLDSVELTLLLEDEFNIAISDAEIALMPTVQAVYDMVQKKKGIE